MENTMYSVTLPTSPQHLSHTLIVANSNSNEPTIPSISLESSVTATSLLNCHLQEQSLLFDKLPAELRNTVWALSTLPDDDHDHTYAESDFWSRPGCRAKAKYNTSLLLTCRRIWLESNDLPMRQARFQFFFKDEDRRPQWTRKQLSSGLPNIQGRASRGARRQVRLGIYETEEARFTRFFKRLTPASRRNIQSVQLFTQMYWLEQGNHLQAFLSQTINYHNLHTRVIWPTIVTFTIKHTDWWYWESSEKLRMDDSWVPMLLTHDSFYGANTFRLELETIKLNEGQLQELVANIKQRHVSPGQWTIDENSGQEISTWWGPSDIGDHRAHTFQTLGRLHYTVYALVWSRDGDEAPVYNETKAKGQVQVGGRRAQLPNSSFLARELA